MKIVGKQLEWNPYFLNMQAIGLSYSALPKDFTNDIFSNNVNKFCEIFVKMRSMEQLQVAASEYGELCKNCI